MDKKVSDKWDKGISRRYGSKQEATRLARGLCCGCVPTAHKAKARLEKSNEQG